MRYQILKHFFGNNPYANCGRVVLEQILNAIVYAISLELLL